MITMLRRKMKYLELLLDDESDIPALPTDCAIGSLAIIASTKRVLVFNSKGEWI